MVVLTATKGGKMYKRENLFERMSWIVNEGKKFDNEIEFLKFFIHESYCLHENAWFSLNDRFKDQETQNWCTKALTKHLGFGMKDYRLKDEKSWEDRAMDVMRK